MSKPVTGVAILMLARGRQGPADRSGVAVHSRVQGHQGRDREAAPPAGDRAAAARRPRARPGRRGARRSTLVPATRDDHRSRSADAHLGPRERRRRHHARATASRRATRAATSRRTSRSSAPCRSTSSRAPSGATARSPAWKRSAASSKSRRGMTFDQFLKQRIFDPLGMKDTAFFPAEDKLSRVASSVPCRRQG